MSVLFAVIFDADVVEKTILILFGDSEINVLALTLIGTYHVSLDVLLKELFCPQKWLMWQKNFMKWAALKFRLVTQLGLRRPVMCFKLLSLLLNWLYNVSWG